MRQMNQPNQARHGHANRHVLRHLCNPERKRSKTIFTLLKSEQIPQMIEIINKVTGGLDKPDTGICFALPTTFVEGVNKNK